MVPEVNLDLSCLSTKCVIRNCRLASVLFVLSNFISPDDHSLETARFLQRNSTVVANRDPYIIVFYRNLF